MNTESNTPSNTSTAPGQEGAPPAYIAKIVNPQGETDYVWNVYPAGFCATTTDRDGALRFTSADSAWWALYHHRIDSERDYERRTGLCSSCGEKLDPSDADGHDDDTEEANAIAELARGNAAGAFLAATLDTVNTGPGVAAPALTTYAVEAAR